MIAWHFGPKHLSSSWTPWSYYLKWRRRSRREEATVADVCRRVWEVLGVVIVLSRFYTIRNQTRVLSTDWPGLLLSVFESERNEWVLGLFVRVLGSCRISRRRSLGMSGLLYTASQQDAKSADWRLYSSQLMDATNRYATRCWETVHVILQ